MSVNVHSVDSKTARPRLSAGTRPSPVRPLQGAQPEPDTDIVAIGNVTLGLYISGLFQSLGWTTACVATLAEGEAALRKGSAAVVVCEETLPDGSWRDVACALGPAASAPVLIVVSSNRTLEREVMERGGFDALARPLRESDVMWSVASAWHAWMKRNEAGGLKCNDA